MHIYISVYTYIQKRMVMYMHFLYILARRFTHVCACTYMIYVYIYMSCICTCICRYNSRVLAVCASVSARVSVCLSVCLSVRSYVSLADRQKKTDG